MYTKQIHYVSGSIIFLFICLHLANHTVSIYGAEQHIQVMNTLRVFYRSIIAETILLLSILVQIVTGIKLYRQVRHTTSTNFEKLQNWTGLYLAFFFLIHLSAVFAGRFLLKLDTNFYFGVAGLNVFPFNLFFIPYYGLAILAFFGHIAAIHNKKMKLNKFGLSPKTQAKLILMFGFILMLIILFGLTNHFKGVKIPETYKILIGK